MKNPNLTWKEYSANEVSHSMAHYLVTLRDLRASQGYARVSDIADELGVTKGTVSQQIRHLKERGYVLVDKARHLNLTEAGLSIARQIIYNRGTLIRFLNKVLRVDSNQAEIDACKMEHLLSPIASHKLLVLVKLLLSEDSNAASLLEKFKNLLPENKEPEATPQTDISKETASAGNDKATRRKTTKKPSRKKKSR